VYKTTVAVLATCPPPLGGISIHAQRVVALLRMRNNRVYQFDIEHEYQQVFFFIYYIKLIAWLIYMHPKTIHYHGISLHRHVLELFVLVFYAYCRKAHITIIHHSSRFVCERGVMYHALLSLLVRMKRVHQVFVGAHTRDAFEKKGLPITERSTVESPFLPPDRAEEKKIIELYPQSLKDFINNHKPFIVVNASRCVRWQGVDVYGLDMAIELIRSIKNYYPQAGLVCAVSAINDYEYWHTLNNNAKDYKNIYWLLGCEQELWPLIAQADVFVRPTLSDGVSISIDEALFLGTPVVASDVCVRQLGVLTFISRNQYCFNRAVLNILAQHIYYPKIINQEDLCNT
jgi:glycosyltransferase involved in cell wall biosynthesis